MKLIGTLIQKSDLKLTLQNLNSLLLVTFGFIVPMWVAPANILSLLIFLLWLVQANLKNDLESILKNTLVQAVIVFWLLHLIGLFWSTDLSYGMEIIAKESLLLLIPIFMMVFRKKHVHLAIAAFMASMMLSCLLSFLIWFKVNPNIFRFDSSGDPIPFMGRVSYAPYLTIAVYISLYYLLFNPAAGKRDKIFAALTALILSIDLFITNGRAGQVMFFIMIIVVIFQYYSKRLLRAVMISAITLPLCIVIAYNASERFRFRVKQAVNEVGQYHENKDTSVGQRITFVTNSLEIIRDNPLFGVGTGDFKREYAQVNSRNTPGLPSTVQPHNMYVLELVQFGVLGLASLLSILYTQIRIALRSTIPLQKYFGLILPILYAVIMLSDSYLLGHFTTMMFVFLSAIIYRDYT